MIHLNLIDVAERSVNVDSVAPVNVTNFSGAVSSSKKKTLAIFLGLVFIVVGFCSYLSILGVPQPLQGMLPSQFLDLIGAEDPSRAALALGNGRMTTAGGSLAAQREALANEIKRRSAMPVKEIVAEVNHKALFSSKRVDFDSFLPLEKLSFMRSATNQFFAFLTTATPDDVGFTDCVFQAPNFFYVRGVAAKPTSQRSFLDRVKSVSDDFRTPPLPENAPATDITAFGKFRIEKPDLSSISSFVPASEMSSEMKALKVFVSGKKIPMKGFEKPIVDDFGVYKRYTYKTSAKVDFDLLQAFITGLAESPIRIGIRSVELKFLKKDMMATVLFEMLVSP